MKFLLPIAALVTIGLIFMMGRERAAVVEGVSTSDLAVLGSGLRLSNPRFAGVTETGEPFVVTADWALPDAAMPDEIALERPMGSITLSDGLEVTASAAAGVMYRQSKQVNLDGSVVIESSDGYRIETESVDIDLEAKSAEARGAISGSGPRGGIDADRAQIVQIDGESLVIRFEGNVRVKFVPETGP